MQVDQKAGLQVLVNLSHDTDLEFIKQRTKKGPLFVFMVVCRREAIQALQGLVHVDPASPELVRKLQNEVQRFLDLVEFVKKVSSQGFESALQLRTEEENELREVMEAEIGDTAGADA